MRILLALILLAATAHAEIVEVRLHGELRTYQCSATSGCTRTTLEGQIGDDFVAILTACAPYDGDCLRRRAAEKAAHDAAFQAAADRRAKRRKAAVHK